MFLFTLLSGSPKVMLQPTWIQRSQLNFLKVTRIATNKVKFAEGPLTFMKNLNSAEEVNH